MLRVPRWSRHLARSSAARQGLWPTTATTMADSKAGTSSAIDFKLISIFHWLADKDTSGEIPFRINKERCVFASLCAAARLPSSAAQVGLNFIFLWMRL